MELFRNKMVYFISDDVISVNKAIITAILPLINNEHIKEEFIDKVIKEFETNCSKFVLNNQTLILHLSPEQKLNLKNGITLSYFTKSINFNDKNDLKFIIAISSTTEQHYQETLQKTRVLFDDEKVIKKLSNIQSLKAFIEELEKIDI